MASATLRRIAQGIKRFVLECTAPFIVERDAMLFSNSAGDVDGSGLDNGGAPNCGSKRKTILVTAFISKHYSGVVGTDLRQPLGTVTAVDHHSLVISHLIRLRNNQFGQSMREPISTLTAGGCHIGEVRTFLEEYVGAGDDHTLIKIGEETFYVADIGLRMLQPHELARAQGFSDSYILNPYVNGKPLSKTSQVRMIGNSVFPAVAEAIVRANFGHESMYTEVAA